MLSIFAACNKCNKQQTSLPQVELLSAGDLAAAAADTFIYCPGTQIECTGYQYSQWSACGTDGTQTREVTTIPPDCNIDPPFRPEATTRPCPCTDYTYSGWSACGTDGNQTREVTGKLPPGCAGDPPNPPVVKQPCTSRIYSGPFDIQGSMSVQQPGYNNTMFTCSCTGEIAGNLKVTIGIAPDDTYSGSVSLTDAYLKRPSCTLTPPRNDNTPPGVCLESYLDNSWPVSGTTETPGTMPDLLWTQHQYGCDFLMTISGTITTTSIDGTMSYRRNAGGICWDIDISGPITLPRSQ